MRVYRREEHGDVFLGTTSLRCFAHLFETWSHAVEAKAPGEPNQEGRFNTFRIIPHLEQGEFEDIALALNGADPSTLPDWMPA